MSKLIKQAFTLIELLVVIAIIGILSGLIVVSMGGMTTKANIAKSQVFSNSLRNALMSNILAQYTFDDITDYNSSTKVMNSTVGNIPDSWNDNEGQAFGGPTLKDESDCISGHCLFLDGADDYINCGSGTLTNADAITVSFWVNDAGWGGYNRWIINKGSTVYAYTDLGIYRAYMNTSYMTRINTTSSTYTVALDVPMNVWNFITISFDSSANTLKSYINGKIYATTTTAGKLVINSSPLFVGDFNTANNYRPLVGKIDDLRIFSAALSISQIKEQYI